MNLKRALYFMILLMNSLLGGLGQALAQKTHAERVSLALQGDLLIITYDLVGTAAAEFVYPEISTHAGIKIDARTLSGDLGENISVGNGKRIQWNYRKDGLEGGDDVNVVVLVRSKANAKKEIIEIIDPSIIVWTRDVILLKSADKITGLVKYRFANDVIKIDLPNGTAVRSKAEEVEKITLADPGRSEIIDTVYTSLGDVISGKLVEVLPLKGIRIKVSKSNTLFVSMESITKVVSLLPMPYTPRKAEGNMVAVLFFLLSAGLVILIAQIR